MPAATGRGTDPRTVTLTTTASSAAVTAAAGTFNPPEDVGRTVTATGIPAGTTLSAVASDTAATLSANATASGARSTVIGGGSGQAQGFVGWSPETDTEANAYSVSAANAGTLSPDRVSDPFTDRQTSGRRGR